jgi:CubicO group peptidase (beta-lactamase class C family)
MKAFSGGLRADIVELLSASVRQRIFPGAVAALVSDTDELYIAVGQETYDPSAISVTKDSVFDVASLTKVVATATAIMQLVDQNRISLQDLACKYLPRLASSKKHISISHLLAHMAGFTGITPLYLTCKSRDQLLEAIFSIDLLYSPGTDRVYDDLGYILLGLIVESVTGITLDAYCSDAIFRPLNMRNTMFVPHNRFFGQIVPTEIDPERGGLLRGVVHDENAFVLGGIAGHAGLFSSAPDPVRFVRMFLVPHETSFPEVLSDTGIGLMCARQWQDGEGEYGLCWDRTRPGYMGRIDDPDAVGHTGFTGVSITISPRRGLAVLLLSNRVHPVRSDRAGIDSVRRSLVEAVVRHW